MTVERLITLGSLISLLALVTAFAVLFVEVRRWRAERRRRRARGGYIR
jgi:hypothetical protein